MTWDPDGFDESRPNGVIAQTDPGSGTWEARAATTTMARWWRTDTGDRCGNGVVESGSTVVLGLATDVDTWVVRTSRSEDRESGIDILEMNPERKQIGGRRIGNGDMGAFAGSVAGPAVTCWDTAHFPGSTHRSAQVTRCQYTVRLIGNQEV